MPKSCVESIITYHYSRLVFLCGPYITYACGSLGWTLRINDNAEAHKDFCIGPLTVARYNGAFQFVCFFLWCVPVELGSRNFRLPRFPVENVNSFLVFQNKSLPLNSLILHSTYLKRYIVVVFSDMFTNNYKIQP